MRPLLALLALVSFLRADPPRRMTLAFEDNFDGTALDPAKWSVPASTPPANLRVAEGRLSLGITEVANDGWVGVGVSSRRKFQQALGYFEASIRFGRHPGHHGVFRLMPEETPKPGARMAELYVAEGFGDDVVITWIRHHDGKALRDEKPSNLKPLPAGAAGDKFNTYGLEWTPRELTWYLNGRKVHSLRIGVAQDKLFLNLGHTVSEFEQPRLDRAKLPDNVEFDWVKVWR
jgi:beta-glucanase (GH16 family)